MPKQDWPWRMRRCPWPRSRPPWPMSLKERLYEVRKRRRKTEIPSEKWRYSILTTQACRPCPYYDCQGALWHTQDCPISRNPGLFRRCLEAGARFHRLTLRERLYEVRKRKERRVRIAVHTYLKRKHPLRYYLHRRALYAAAPSYHPPFSLPFLYRSPG